MPEGWEANRFERAQTPESSWPDQSRERNLRPAWLLGNNDQMAAMKMTGNADADFATMMRMHHQGAIDMAEALLRTGKDPEMLKMAKKIIADQKKEIAQFDKYLAKHPHDSAKK
jgi:uncharacterized protein (DUF305 family)